jgi:hypothetical protein
MWLLQDSPTERWDAEAGQQGAMFIVLEQTQQTRVQRLSPENKGDLLYIPLKADYRSIWLHTISFILDITLSSMLRDPSHVQFP